MNESETTSGPALGLEAAAAYLGISPKYLYKKVHFREIAFYKPSGGRLVFTKADLDAYLFRNRHAADFELHERADAALIGGRR